ncbi:hypothetical protein Tco_0975555 [Tanacetum coccineum]|uniref:Uncharacterized protein n=1 Tax=Tanacetum coccineum TaxID=301880 RepID=A0ABQ5EEP8_9ASTR
MGSGLLPENAPPLGSFVIGAQNLPCSFLGIRFLRTHENNLKLEGPGTRGSGSQNRARALEVIVVGIIFSLALTKSISSKVSSRSSESGNATSLPALESSLSSESLATFRAEIAAKRTKLRFMLAYKVSKAVITTTFLPRIILGILERKGLLQDRLFNLMLGEQNLSHIMELSLYTNIWREAYDFLEGKVEPPLLPVHLAYELGPSAWVRLARLSPSRNSQSFASNEGSNQFTALAKHANNIVTYADSLLLG